MRLNDITLPSELDERLHEWARFFKDRHKYSRCASIEGRFSPFAPGSWDEGWGNQDESPPAPVPPALNMNRVLLTHQAVNELEKAQKWAITYGYCYPSLERWRILKFLRKYAGRRFTWNEYLETLDFGRLRVWAVLNK